ncbi:MAG: hypothetical protein ACKOE8_12305 [Opitutaceae bacterium]
MNKRIRLLPLFFLLLAAVYPLHGAEPDKSERGSALRACRGTYAGQPRLASGRVDRARLLEELADLGANTYNWLIWHRETDWDDLRAFLPEARTRGLKVWVTIVPPSESPPKARMYAEPYRLDYPRWAEEIARLSLAEPALVAWSIDDFAHNLKTFTPGAVREMLDRAREVNPRLAFVPCVYFRQITPAFAANYAPLLDGILFPYRNESVRADLNDPRQVAAEVAKVRELVGLHLPVIIDVYASRHSSLGDSTPDYVAEVLRSGQNAADGVMVYCHQNPQSQRAKYAVIRDAFGGRR